MRGRYLILAILISLLVAVPPVVSAGFVDDPDQTSALAEASKSRIRQLGRLAADSPEGMPFRRVDGSSGFASVIIPKRAAPYTVPELARLFPESITEQDTGIFLIRDDLIVGEGASLEIESSSARELRLLSTPTRFVTITSWRGSIQVVGTEQQIITVTSWNPDLSGPDTTQSDGRAWLHSRRGNMSIAWATMQYLGFETGSLSGVAWEGRPEEPTRGNVSHTSFQYNHFGAYTFEALEMEWRYNTFAYNTGYGFDPHDHSNHFTVEFNRAFNNGSHGIIFSRGCTFNTIRSNESFNNGMHGIVLDDGPNLNPDGTLRERPGIPSDENTVTGNTVYGNQVGIVLDGGTGNTISNNVITGNEYGIRMKDAVQTNTVSGNQVTSNRRFGIYLYNHSDDNVISGNTVTGSDSGIVIKDSTGNEVTSNDVHEMSENGVSLGGNVGGTIISHNSITDVQTAVHYPDVGSTEALQVRGNTISDEASAKDDASLRTPARRWILWALVLMAPVLLGPWWGRLVHGLRSGWPTMARFK